jgi:hypothetical protein
MTEDIELPVEANLPTPERDAAKEAAMQAAFFHQQAVDERKRILDTLAIATKAIEQKNFQIDQLNLRIAEDANRYAVLQAERDELFAKTVYYQQSLANAREDIRNAADKLDRFELPPAVKRSHKRKRDLGADDAGSNGNAALPDTNGSQGEVAGSAPVLAQPATVLGQQASE